MTDFHALIDSYQNCACGQAHTCAIRDIEIGSGLVSEVGEILKKNGFGPRLLLAADEQTLAAADGIEASLSGFTIVRHIWPSIRVATMQDVKKIESYFDRVDGVLAVGMQGNTVVYRAHCKRQFQDHLSRKMPRGHHRRYKNSRGRPGSAQIRRLRRHGLEIHRAHRLAGIESSDRGILL